MVKSDICCMKYLREQFFWGNLKVKIHLKFSPTDPRDLSELPQLHDRHVPPQPDRVPHLDGLQEEPGRRRLRGGPCPRLPRAVGTHKLPGMIFGGNFKPN